MEQIKTSGLTKFYGKARGILDVDLTVEEGDIFGFIGPNGAGKSTTIRTLLGLIAPSGGTAQVLGMPIGRTEILREVGYMPSEAMFYSGMRVADILRLSAGLRKKDCVDEAKVLCDRLELDIRKKVDELSLGNRKKVGIVCAMQHRPRLYILDEPTSGLDPLMQKAFFTLLQERHQAGATVFLSSHVLSELQRYCTRAAIIREGRLIAAGSMTELTGTKAHRVVLRGVTVPPELVGLRDVNVTEDSVSFLYGGALSPLLEALRTLPLTDLSITEPDLEETFLHFYEKGGQA